MNSMKKSAEYHSIVFTEKIPQNVSRFEHQIKKALQKQLGDSLYIKYVPNIGEKIQNLNECLQYLEKYFGELDNSTTFNIKRKIWDDQKIVLINWKNKKRALNRIFG